jgi:hypothetical protein
LRVGLGEGLDDGFGEGVDDRRGDGLGDDLVVRGTGEDVATRTMTGRLEELPGWW